MAFKDQMWQVIEWTDDSANTIVYRFPHAGKGIISGTQLTVRPSQVAIFVVRGQIADIFQPGKHKLDSKNLPILAGMGALFFRDKKWPNQADLYYVNTKQFVNQKWGTPRPLVMQDKTFGIIRVGAFGSYAFKVSDAGRFMTELFGTNTSFKVEDINTYLKSMLVSCVTDTIAESKVSALEIYANLQEFGTMCENNVTAKFRDLGLTATNFVIESISFPEQVEKAMDERASLGILSDQMGTYTQKKAADALGDAARNPGMAGTMMGIGIGQQTGAVMGGVMGAVNQNEPKEDVKFCPDCGAKMPAASKFCPECGKKFASKGVCSKCGAKVAPGAKFCPDCGAKQ